MAFDPTTLFPGAAGAREGAIIKIRPENLWQDEAGTVAVTTAGDPVRRITDISVNGRDFICYDTAAPPTYQTDGTVHWINNDGGNTDQGFVSADLWDFMDGSPYTVGAAIDFDDPGSGDQYFFGTTPASPDGTSGSGTSNSVVHLGARTGSTATIAHWFDDQDFSHSFPTNTPERHICEYKNPGSEYTVDGAQIDVSATTPSAIDQIELATLMIREPYAVTEKGLNGQLYGMIIVVDTITAQEKADIDEWLQEQIEGPTETSGTLESQAATMDGTGTIDTPASGTLEAQAATADGAATVEYVASGTPEAQAATMEGAALPGIFHVASEKATTASSDTVTVGKPTGAAEGDLALIVASADDGGTNTITLPAGFTSVHNAEIPNSEVGSVRIAIGYKILGGSEPASYDVTFAAIDANVASCSVWRNVDPTDTLDVAFEFTTRGPSLDETLPPAPTVTTVSDGAAIITIVADTRGPSFGDMDFEDYYQPPVGTTEVVDANIGAGTDMAGHAVGWEIQTNSGATGTRQWACIDNNDGGFAGTLVLRENGATVTSDRVADGDLLAQAATMDGTAGLEYAASGTLESQAATADGTAGLEYPASGTLESQAATADGAGEVEYPASGTLEAQDAAVDGSASGESGVQGSLEAQDATMDGAGTVEYAGSGSLEAASAAIDGEGTQTYTGTGSLAAQAATIDGSAQAEMLAAAGALLAQAATMDGEADFVDPIQASGDMQAQDATVAGTGNLDTPASGALLARSATMWASTTGIGDFYWNDAPTTAPGRRPAPRRFRPLVWVDRTTGTNYVLMHDGASLASLVEFTPRTWDEVYEPYSEPTMVENGEIIRVFVDDGVLRWERYDVDVRQRPILFGRVARPGPREPRYRLRLNTTVL